MKCEVSSKAQEATCEFKFSKSQDNKIGEAKDHGKKFQSKLAASFSGIVHCIVSLPGDFRPWESP